MSGGGGGGQGGEEESSGENKWRICLAQMARFIGNFLEPVAARSLGSAQTPVGNEGQRAGNQQQVR